MKYLLLWLMIGVTPEQYEHVKDATYLGANQIRYFDAVAIGPRKLLTASVNTPKKYRDDALYLKNHEGIDAYGYITNARNGIDVIEVAEDLPAWAAVPYRAPRVGERVLVVSIKQNFRTYTTVRKLERGSNRFAMDFRYGNSGCGIYDDAGQLLGVWWGKGRWGNGPEYGIGLAFGVFH